MITGTISQRRAYVSLVVRGPAGQQGEVEFVLDTGFTGAMTLPPAACTALVLPLARVQPVLLADGTRAILQVYDATVEWIDGPEDVEVLAMTGSPLIGMSLLEGCDVRLQVIEGGLLTIETL
jgi:clan AA aspartic protease